MYIWCPTPRYPTNLLCTLCLRSLLHALFPLCRVVSVHCMRPFFLWSLEKTTQFPWTSTVQMFGGECRSCSRQKKSGSPRLWSSRYLGDLIDVPIEADAKDLRPVSCTNRNQEQRFGDSLNRLMRCAEQTGKINWNYLDEGNQCGFSCFPLTWKIVLGICIVQLLLLKEKIEKGGLCHAVLMLTPLNCIFRTTQTNLSASMPHHRSNHPGPHKREHLVRWALLFR